MSVLNYKDLKGHIGHDIECIGYKKKGEKFFRNVAILCNNCCEVLLDFDIPKIPKKPKRQSFTVSKVTLSKKKKARK